MRKTKIAINGFGRIGRVTARFILDNPDLELVAINDLTDSKTLGHLFKYDSVHRAFNGTVSVSENNLVVNSKNIKVYSERDPENLPWKSLDIDVVIESTGFFRTEELANKHIIAGARRCAYKVIPA